MIATIVIDGLVVIEKERMPNALGKRDKLPPVEEGGAIATAEDGVCIECSQFVHSANDARLLSQQIVELGGRRIPFQRSRHVRPINHPKPCRGTPWLAQYLLGQPRLEGDNYDPQFEYYVRQANQILEDTFGPADSAED